LNAPALFLLASTSAGIARGGGFIQTFQVDLGKYAMKLIFGIVVVILTTFSALGEKSHAYELNLLPRNRPASPPTEPRLPPRCASSTSAG
jgi:hypothetical protein